MCFTFIHAHTQQIDTNNVCTHPNHSSRGEGCRLQGVRRQKNQRRDSRRPVRRRVVANCGTFFIVALKNSRLFATWVKFFFTFYARVDSTRGERRREAFGSVCVAVKLNALDFVRFERGRFLRRICSRCCCCCVCSSARFSMMMMMMIISDCVWTTEKLSPLFSSAR